MESVDASAYTYAILRPYGAKLPAYIGKGHGNRAYDHEKYGDSHDNAHLANVFAKCKRLGLRPIIEIIQTGLVDNDALLLEIEYIYMIGRADQKRGPLCNHTEGGEGVVGYIASAELRAKRSVNTARLMENPERREAASARMIGNQFVVEYARSPAGRLAASKVHKGKTIPEQTRKAAAKSAAERVWTDESREKVAASKRGKKRDAKTVEGMKQRAMAQMADPEARAVIGKANSERVWTPEMRKNVAEGGRRAREARGAKVPPK